MYHESVKEFKDRTSEWMNRAGVIRIDLKEGLERIINNKTPSGCMTFLRFENTRVHPWFAS